MALDGLPMSAIGVPTDKRRFWPATVCPLMSSRPEESHPRALPDPCVNLSIHTAPDVQPLAHAASSFTSFTGSSCWQLGSVGPWPRLNNAAHWDRSRARLALGEGFPFLLFRLQDGFTVPPWLTFP